MRKLRLVANSTEDERRVTAVSTTTESKERRDSLSSNKDRGKDLVASSTKEGSENSTQTMALSLEARNTPMTLGQLREAAGEILEKIDENGVWTVASSLIAFTLFLLETVNMVRYH